MGKKRFLWPCSDAKLSVTLRLNPAIFLAHSHLLSCLNLPRTGKPSADSVKTKGFKCTNSYSPSICPATDFILSLFSLYHRGWRKHTVEIKAFHLQWDIIHLVSLLIWWFPTWLHLVNMHWIILVLCQIPARKHYWSMIWEFLASSIFLGICVAKKKSTAPCWNTFWQQHDLFILNSWSEMMDHFITLNSHQLLTTSHMFH